MIEKAKEIWQESEENDSHDTVSIKEIEKKDNDINIEEKEDKNIASKQSKESEKIINSAKEMWEKIDEDKKEGEDLINKEKMDNFEDKEEKNKN